MVLARLWVTRAAPCPLCPPPLPAAPARELAEWQRQPLSLTRHGRCRMSCRHFDRGEVEQFLKEGTLVPERTRLDGACPSHALEGTTRRWATGTHGVCRVRVPNETCDRDRFRHRVALQLRMRRGSAPSLGYERGMNELVLVSTTRKVTTLTMNLPQRLNGWTLEMMGAITQALQDAAESDDTAVVVLTGQDPYYSAGRQPLVHNSALASSQAAKRDCDPQSSFVRSIHRLPQALDRGRQRARDRGHRHLVHAFRRDPRL